MRVSHKRLLTAACAGYKIDGDNNGITDSDGKACGCKAGASSCSITITNPKKINELSAAAGSTMYIRYRLGCIRAMRVATCVTTAGGKIECTDATLGYPLCPDGSGGGTKTQCTVGCMCSAFTGVIQVPANALTSQYNFTWSGTKLPPNTSGTDAYQDFVDRPTPY